MTPAIHAVDAGRLNADLAAGATASAITTTTTTSTAVSTAAIASYPRAQQRLSDEVRAAYDYLPATLAGNVAGLGVIGLLFTPITAWSVLLPWLCAFGLMLALRIVLGLRFRKRWHWVRTHPGAVPMDWARWRLGWNIGTLCSGLLWGTTAWIFFGRGDGNQQIALVITVYTFCIAAVPVLATQPRVYLAFAALCFVPLITRLVLDGTRHGLELAGILLLIFTLTSVLARSFRDTVGRAFDLKLQSDDLLVQLRAEGAVALQARQAAEAEREAADEARSAAEIARREAETASRAKTQFFAAASHDLRQPLHAMGLFAEALRQRSHDEPTLALVNSINASVHALEGLFSELLDINRIDAGGVQPRPTAFVVGDLFRKLAVHHQPDAFEKGLDLRFRGGDLAVHADPLLVERILRNLLGNAIRYTDEGSVLVSARRRGGRVVLQVWDTGVGISADEQTRVFDEFYQVNDDRQLASHEKKGLGLGLSIVKRLADLMHAPMSLRSSPGCGTVFAVTVPRAVAPVVSPAPMRTAALAMPALAGRRVLVVEDDPAVLGGLQVLLAAWGAEVQAHARAGDLDGALADGRIELPMPDLLLVDYRLEGDRTGVQVIEQLRSHWRSSIPAIVVTGSTMSGLEQEAARHGFHLLVKPVVPAKLRAMVNFKLAGLAVSSKSNPAASAAQTVMSAGTPDAHRLAQTLRPA